MSVTKSTADVQKQACGCCGDPVKVIACIEEQDVIDKILTHLREKLSA